MKISFTICSANYLPFAKSLADSLVKYNPDHRFYIILLDRVPEKDMSFFQPHRLITAEEMQVTGFEEMNEKVQHLRTQLCDESICGRLYFSYRVIMRSIILFRF